MTADEIKGNKYLIDANGKPMRPEDAQFGSQKEMVDAMADVRYATDPDYRALVAFMVGNSPTTNAPTTGRQLSHAMADVPSLKAQRQQAIVKEKTLEMFANPLYQTSESYRSSVEEFIRENSVEIDKAVGDQLIDRNVRKHESVRVQLGTVKDDVKVIQGDLRASKIDKARAAAAERKAAVDKSLADEIEELNATARPDSDEYSPA